MQKNIENRTAGKNSGHWSVDKLNTVLMNRVYDAIDFSCSSKQFLEIANGNMAVKPVATLDDFAFVCQFVGENRFLAFLDLGTSFDENLLNNADSKIEIDELLSAFSELAAEPISNKIGVTDFGYECAKIVVWDECDGNRHYWGVDYIDNIKFN